MKKLLLTENQIKNVINHIISEQSPPQVQPQQSTVTPFTVDFGNGFESGQFKMSPNYEQVVNGNVQKILDYIKGKNIKDFKVVITPGESQVTNQPPFQVKGSLASARSTELKNYLTPIFQKSFSVPVVIETTKPIIGQTPWDPKTGNKDDAKYKAEQFVKVSIVLTTQITPTPTPPVETPYKITAKDKESIYFPTQYTSYLGAFAQYPTRESLDIKDAGNLNTGVQDVTLKIIKKDTVPFQVTDVYLIPFAWWNNRTGAETNFLQPQDLEYIKKNFKRL
jgi:hypothetical protein